MVTNKELLPIAEIIKRALERGVDFGSGNPENRIRYYIKFGLLPHAKRKSFNGAAPTAAFRLEVVDRIVQIEKLRKRGKSVIEQKQLLTLKSANKVYKRPTGRQPQTEPETSSKNNTLLKYSLAASAIIAILLLTSLLANFIVPNQENSQVLGAQTKDENLLVKVGKAILTPVARVNLALLKVVKNEQDIDPLDITNIQKDLKRNSSGILTSENLAIKNLEVKKVTGKETTFTDLGKNCVLTLDPDKLLICDQDFWSSEKARQTAEKAANVAISRLNLTSSNVTLSSSSLSFRNILISGQNTVIADSSSDNLTFIAGNGISFSTNSANDSITISSTVVGGSGSSDASTFDTFDSTQFLRSDVSDNFTIGTLTFDAGTTVSVLGNFNCTNCITDSAVANNLTLDSTSNINSEALTSGTLGNVGVILALGSFGSITGSLGDANIADTITASNYLLLAGGTMAGDIDFNSNLALNIGNAGTDFTAGGGLNLASTLTLGGDANLYRSAAGIVKTDNNFVIGGTTGLTFSGIGGDIAFTNGESINNDTDGFIKLIGNAAVGNGTLTYTNGQSILQTIGNVNNAGGACPAIGFGGCAGIFSNPTVNIDSPTGFTYGISAALTVNDSTAGTITLLDGVSIGAGDLVKGTNDAITNAYGVHIQNITAGTNNVGLCFDCIDGAFSSTSISAGILWGPVSDANNVSLYRVANSTLGIPTGKNLRLATDGSTGGLQFGATGDAVLYRGGSNTIYLGSSDSFRINTDGSNGSGNLQFGSAGDTILFRPNYLAKALTLYSSSNTYGSATTLELSGNGTSTFIEQHASGLSFFNSYLKSTSNETWRLDNTTGILKGFKNDIFSYGDAVPSFINLQQNVGVMSSSSVLIEDAKAKLTKVFTFDGTTYTDVTTIANNSTREAYFTIAADTNDFLYFGDSTNTISSVSYDIKDSNWNNFGSETYQYASSSAAGVCNGWTTVPNYVETYGLALTGYDYWDPINTGSPAPVSCSVNGSSNYWVRVGFSSFTGVPMTAYSLSKSVKLGKSLEIKVDGSSVFSIGNDGTISNDLKIGNKPNQTTHSFDSGCSCILNTSSTAGSIGGDTSVDSIYSSAVYNGKLYVSTKETNAAAVYRFDGNNTWTQVSDATNGKIIAGDAADSDAIILTVWDGYLIAGSQTAANTGTVYRYNGSTWTPMHFTRGTLGADANIDGISDLLVWNSRLYVVTQEANAAGLYSYDGGLTFTRINATLGKGLAEATADIDEGRLIVYNGHLWWGTVTGAAANTARVYKYDGNTFTLMNSAAGTFSSVTNIDDVTAMGVYNGSLFVGITDSTANSADIFMYKGSSDRPTTPGNDWFKTTSTTGRIDWLNDATDVDGVTVLRTYNGRFYAGTNNANAATLYELQYSTSVTGGWVKINNARGTFGGQTSVDYIQSLIEYNGSLYVGTEEANAGSIYSWSKTSSNSYNLSFDSGNGNLGSIGFVSGASSVGLDNNGTFFFTHGISSVTGAYDIAEDYLTRDESLAPGDLVVLDTSEKGFVRKSDKEYDQTMLGIYSGNPGFRLSQVNSTENGAKYVPIALNGRVEVKVSTENGLIDPGDFLTSSSTPGVAMKANKTGPVIGKSLESFTGTGVGKVLVFVQNSFYIEPKDFNPYTLNDVTNLSSELGVGYSYLLKGTSGKIVASINELGEAAFSKVTTVFANVGKLVFGEIAVDKKANTAGQAVVDQGKSEVLIKSDKVKEDSLINLTPDSEPDGILYVKEKKAGEGFVVGIKRIDQASKNKVSFSWFILNQE